jgi:hypothetical protein
MFFIICKYEISRLLSSSHTLYANCLYCLLIISAFYFANDISMIDAEIFNGLLWSLSTMIVPLTMHALELPKNLSRHLLFINAGQELIAIARFAALFLLYIMPFAIFAAIIKFLLFGFFDSYFLLYLSIGLLSISAICGIALMIANECGDFPLLGLLISFPLILPILIFGSSITANIDNAAIDILPIFLGISFVAIPTYVVLSGVMRR